MNDARFGDRERERLFSLLSAHAAADHIDLEELERRVVAVSEADGAEQAEAVLADLPALPEGMLLSGSATGFGDRPPEAGAEAGRPRWGRGHADSDQPADGWRATGERFRVTSATRDRVRLAWRPDP